MLNTKKFGDTLLFKGINFFSGVPCSFLKNLINYVSNETNYIMAPNEGDAVALCVGAYLGGKTPAVLFQNSGLGNAVSPLTSLTHTFKIPLLGFVSLRGEPALKDEPQHQLMGEITTKLLDAMDIQWAYLSNDETAAEQQLDLALATIKKGKTFFFIVKKNTFSKHALISKTISNNKNTHLYESFDIPKTTSLPHRSKILKTIIKHKNNQTIIFATTGYTSRELYSLHDNPTHFYQIGSMGCISAIALGFSQAQPNKKIIILDGDGSLLMRMGNMPTMGYFGSKNICHILLDNGHHESTGSQPTISPHVNFGMIATASGYTNVHNTITPKSLEKIIKEWIETPALTFIRQFIKTGISTPLPRPTITPEKQAQRLKEYVHNAP
jgi:phosphonopyruvate decarboxylase